MNVLDYFSEVTDITDETFTLNENGVKYTYCTTEIIALSKTLKEFDYPLIGFNASVCPWGNIESFDEYLDHLSRIQKADLQYPIILSPAGYIVNGFHRIAKALYEGKDTVKAVRLEKFPTYVKSETIK